MTSTFSEKKYSEGRERENLIRYINGVDPCETLRHYDALEGYNLEDRRLKHVERIVEGIDCIVHTNDPQKDVHRLSDMMQLRKCVEFDYRNSYKKYHWESSLCAN